MDGCKRARLRIFSNDKTEKGVPEVLDHKAALLKASGMIEAQALDRD